MLANRGGHLSDDAMFGVEALVAGAVVAAAALLPLTGVFVAAWGRRKRNQPPAAGAAR